MAPLPYPDEQRDPSAAALEVSLHRSVLGGEGELIAEIIAGT